jgi:hypothetical protein
VICPECGAEYVEGHRRCFDCGVDLVRPAAAVAEKRRPHEAADPRALHHPAHLVPVLTSPDAGLVAVVESALRSAGIPFVSERDDVIDLFAWGRIGGVNPVTGLPRILVDEADVEDALQILEGVPEGVEPGGTPDDRSGRTEE